MSLTRAIQWAATATVPVQALELENATMTDFSNRETQEIFRREVKKRMDDFGMSREQAEMLVAVLMSAPPKPEADESR